MESMVWWQRGKKCSVIVHMTVHEFIRERPHFVWYTKNYDGLSESSIVEATLNYDDWDDVQKLIEILGMRRVAEIFREQTGSHRMRVNYYPEITHYFKHYFAVHA